MKVIHPTGKAVVTLQPGHSIEVFGDFKEGRTSGY